MQIPTGGREAAFYPTASHGRIKENPNPLRPLRLCGEYVTAFMKPCTKRRSVHAGGQTHGQTEPKKNGSCDSVNQDELTSVELESEQAE
jgi:hypothetical protein